MWIVLLILFMLYLASATLRNIAQFFKIINENFTDCKKCKDHKKKLTE